MATKLLTALTVLIQAVLIKSQTYPPLPPFLEDVPPPQSVVISEGSLAELRTGVSWNSNDSISVFKSEVHLGRPSDDKFYCYGSVKVINSNNVEDLDTIKTVQGVVYSVRSDVKRNIKGYGALTFSMDGLIVGNVPDSYQVKRVFLDVDLEDKESILETTIHVVGDPQCLVDTGGQQVLLADNRTQSTLTCRVPYGPGTSGPDIPPGQISVEWEFDADNGQNVTQGSNRFWSNEKQRILDPDVHEGLKFVCTRTVNSQTKTCETPEVHSLPRELIITASPPQGPYYPSSKSVTLRCAGKGYPAPQFSWYINGVLKERNSIEWEPDLSAYSGASVTIMCRATNQAGGATRTSDEEITITMLASTTTTTTDPKAGGNTEEDDKTLMYILIGVLVPLAVIAIIVVFVVFWLRCRNKKPADEDRPPKMIEFDNESPSSDVKKPIANETLPRTASPVEHVNEAYNEMQFDNRPGSRKPIASPLETTESLGSTLDSRQHLATPSLSPYSSLQRPLDQPSYMDERSYTPVRATPVMIDPDPYAPRLLTPHSPQSHSPLPPQSPPSTLPKPGTYPMYPDNASGYGSEPPPYDYNNEY